MVGGAGLAGLQRSGLLALAGIEGVATVYAYAAVAAELAIDALRWVASIPGRVLALPGRLARAFAKRGSGRLRKRLRRWVAPWASWPALARWTWLGLRPLLALAALICIAAFGGASIGAELALALALLAAQRSVRMPLLALPVAAVAVAVSPPTAALFVARIVFGEAVLIGLGRGAGGVRAARRRGLEVVAAARLEAMGRLFETQVPSLERCREDFAAAVIGDSEDRVLEVVAPYAAAAWAHWRWRELLGVARRVARGVYRSDWAGAPGDALERELAPMVLLEEALSAAARLIPLAIAATAAFFLVPAGQGLVFGDSLWGHGASALVTMLIAGPLTRRRISITGAVCAAAFGWLLVGAAIWEVAAIAIATAFAVRSTRRMAESFNFAGRGRWRRWPMPPGTPLRLRGEWRAASKAVESGRERLAVDMFEDLARRAERHDDLFVGALGRAALLEVDLGRLQDAAEHLDEISGRGAAVNGSAAVARGMLSAALGDFGRAAAQLREALDGLDRSSPLRPRARIALSDALVHEGEPDAALELIRELRSEPLAIRGVAGILEAQVTIAAALLERGDRNEAAELLKDASFFAEDDQELPLGGEGRNRLRRAAAEVMMLRGRVMLDSSRTGDAVPHLERAADLAASAEDEALLATAKILHGAALARIEGGEAAVAEIAEGVDLLESRRVQLRAAERRTAMIVAGEQLYASALGGLLGAQRRSVPGAGIAAARLVESLRQSALATTLRAGPLPLDRETRDLIGRVDAGEKSAGDVEHLRALVQEQISSRFAAAYLPTGVEAEQLGKTAREFGHVLSFYVPPNGMPGWRVWVSPDGEAEVGMFGAGRDPGELLSMIAEGGLSDEVVHAPLYSMADEWSRLAEELLPLGLRDAVSRAGADRPPRILVVPDGPLNLVPWSALHVGGEPLFERAVVQVAPVLELVTEDREARPAERVVAHLFEADEAELAPLRQGGNVQPVQSRERFVKALESELFDGAYIASHGDQLGLGQRVELGDGSALSAASALACTWPPWVVFSSCLVGRVEQVVGQEPFGLAISCMLRGADTVVASVVDLTGAGAMACGAVAAQLAAGQTPADALREAQRERMRERQLASLADGLGLVCISMLRAPSRGGEVLRFRSADRIG